MRSGQVSSIVRTSLACSFLVCSAITAQAQTRAYSTAHRNGEHSLEQSLSVSSAKVRSHLASRTLTTMTVADFDSDGVRDLLSAYATGSGGALLLQRGNARATAPLGEDFAQIAAGQPVTPFASRAEATEVPVRPDLLVTGDVAGFGHSDVVLAAKGDTSVYLLPSDGQGGFGPAQALGLSGQVSALAVWRAPSGLNLIAASVCSTSGCGLEMLDHTGKQAGFVPMTEAATGLQMETLSGGHQDLAALTADGVVIAEGDSLLSGSPQLETIPVSNAVAMGLGHFTYDRRGYVQVAVLGSDATLHVFARTGVDNTVASSAELHALRAAMHNHTARAAMASANGASHVKPAALGWSEAETIPGVGPGGPAILLAGRFQGSGMDSVAVLAQGQYVTVDHTQTTENALRTSTPVVTTDSSSSPVTAAVATRLSADSRNGVLTADSQLRAAYTVPSSFRTMTVNTNVDAAPNTTAENACKNGTSGCQLRSAIAVSNSDAGSTGTTKVDTINIQAGTYTLSANNGSVLDANSSKNNYLDIEGSVNIVGAGSSTTTVQSTGVVSSGDKIFSVNINDSTAYDVYFSNFTMQKGINPNDPNGASCYDSGLGCDYFGGNMDVDLGGTGSFGISNMVVANGTDNYDGGGGGILVSNFIAYGNGVPGGSVEIDNSTFSSNTATYYGGGMYIVSFIPFQLNGDTFTSNTVTSPASGDDSQGGALFLEPVSTTGETNPNPASITGCTFTSNTAGYIGGAIADLSGGISISGSTFATNSLTYGASAGSGAGFGGAIYLSNLDHAVTITTSNFTNNNAMQYGGAISVVGSSSGNDVVTVQYSRFHGNTATSGGGGIAAGYIGGSYSTVTATNNWWGCNGAGTGTGCDTATSSAGSDVLTLSPYTTLTIGLTTTTPAYNASFTATGSLGQNSSGTVYSSANAAAYDGVAATLAIVEHGGVTTNSSQSTLTSSAAAPTSYAAITTTATANTAGAGTATVTVDGTSVSTNFTITSPPDMTGASVHTGTFAQGSTGNTYTLTATNSGGASTSGAVTVVDALPSGFTATAMSGTGWSCTVGTLTCTRSDALAASSSYPAITLTVSVSASDVGSYTNTVTVSGGGESNTSNDTATDATTVVGAPQITQGFSPSSIAPNGTSVLTVTLTNPGANTVSLTGAAFTETLPTGVVIGTPNGLGNTCGGTATATAGGSSLSLTGGTIPTSSSCHVTVNVTSPSIGNYTATSGAVSSTNGGTGGTATAMLTVAVTPTKLVFTAAAPGVITAGGNAGTVQVALEDGAGNVATNNSSTVVTLTVTGSSSYSQVYSATAVSGVATFNLSSVALQTADTYLYTATATGLTQTQSTELVTAGTATSFTVTGLGPFAAPGSAGTATVTANDQYGNVATGFTGTVTLSSTDTTATFSPTSYTYVSGNGGVHTFSVTFNTAGTFSVTATSGAVVGSESGIVVAPAVWVLNANTTVVKLNDSGTQVTSAGTASGTASALGLAVDNTGNVWGVLSSTNSVEAYTKSGTAIPVTGSAAAGVSAPTAVAIDGAGRVWIANGNNTVSALNNDGTVATGATPVATAAGLNAPASLTVDSAGSLWISNSGTGAGANTVTEVIGVAAPVVAPTVTAASQATQGARP